MKILGIDPSMTGSGLALIVDGHFKVAQTISTSAEWTRGNRLSYIAMEVESFIETFQPDFVAIEGYSFGSQFNREEMGEVSGVIKAKLFDRNIEPAIWQNTSWKKLVLGAQFKKDEVRLEVFRRYNLAIKDMNQVEAFCVGMAEHLAQSGAPRPVKKPKRKPGTRKVTA
jgi:Holliday junction resolvasome RuvABC endonuclease subunit